MPSTLSLNKCKDLEIKNLADQELLLQIRQANDALHEICIALADKAVLFWTKVQHASSHAKTMRAWGRVNAVDASLHQHALVYRRCYKLICSLAANKALLQRYQLFWDENLKITTAVTANNVMGLWNNKLAWFWSINMSRDTETSI